MSKPILISIFDKNEIKNKVLYGNGLAVLDNICIKCITDEDLVGGYTLDATFIIDDDGIYKNIVEENILKVKMDYGTELFRIAKITPSTNSIEVFARQLTISDTLDIYLSDIRPTNTNAQGALDHILTNSNEYKANKPYAKNLELFSDITKLNTAYYQDMNLYQALHDSDQSFEKRWGLCEIQRRGYRVNLMSTIGQDRGFQVRSRKNLTGFEYESDVETVVTRIKPKGFNGITIDGYVDSPLLGKYSKIKTKVINYEDVKVKDENTTEGFDTLEQAQAELIKRAKLEFSENHIDEIKAKYNISFVALEQTEQYKDYAILERAYLGDTVTVIEDKLGINIKVKAIKRGFNVLRQCVIDMELSNYDRSSNKISIADIVKEIENIPDPDNILLEAKKNATDIINAGIQEGYFTWDTNGWAIMDTRDKNTAMNGIKATKNGIGLFQNGYYGEVISAITSQGIVADVITTGILNANLIKAGVLSTVLLRNGDGSFEIDLSKAGGCLFRNNGKDAINIKNNTIQFFNWAVAGDYIGSLGSLYDSKNKVAYLSLYNDIDSIISIGYDKDGSNIVGTYMYFDKYKLKNKYPITILEKTLFKNDLIMDLRNNLYATRIYGSPEIGNGVAANSIIRMESPVAFDEGVANDLTVRGNIYANNMRTNLNTFSLLSEENKEKQRLVTVSELNTLKSEIEQLKAEIKELKALIIKH